MTPGRSTATAAAAWCCALGAGLAALVATGSDPGPAAAYLLAWLVSTVLPGVLLWRVLARPGPTTAQQVGFGSVLGVAVALLTWLVATAVGAPALGWVLPTALALALLAVPGSRRRLLAPPSARSCGSWRWHAGTALAGVAAVVVLWATHLAVQPLPPAPSATYPDLWYHATLVDELTRAVVPQDPSVVGEPLEYHWFAHAHMALTGAMSSTASFEVVLHAWLVPMVLTLVAASAAAIDLLQGAVRRWWVGPAGALGAVVLPTAWLGASAVSAGPGFTVLSPSNVLAIVVVLAGLGAAAEVLRRPRAAGGWVLYALLVALGAGSKPSVLPVLAAAGALVVLVELLRGGLRRGLLRAPLVLVPAVLLPLASATLFGSTAGATVQLFQSLALNQAVLGLVGGEYRGMDALHEGLLAPFFSAGSRGVWVVAGALLVGTVLANLLRLAGVAALLSPRLRRDPVVVWAAGAVVAGFVGQWLIAHPGYSQLYFWMGVTPLGAVLSVATAARLVPPGRPGRALLVPGALVVAAGLAVGAWTVAAPPPAPSGPWRSVVVGVLLPYALGLAGLVAVAVAVLVLGRRRARRLPAVTALVLFSASVSLPFALHEVAAPVADAALGRVAAPSPEHWVFLTSGEQAGALWLREHSDERDVVATNVVCQPVPVQDACSRQAFWVGALSGRRLVLGGWAYSAASASQVAQSPVGTVHATGPWPDRLAASLDLVTEASAPALQELTGAHDARWLFVDLAATPVSPELEELLDLRFANDAVMVFELPRVSG